MKNGQEHDIEKQLRSVRLRPAPPGLREKILGTAQKRKEAMAWMTPVLWKCLAGCAVLLAVIFIADALLSRNQSHRLQAVLKEPAIMQHHQSEEGLVLAEDLEAVVGPKILATKKMANAPRTHAEQAQRERILRELLKEDFVDSETTKNLH